MDHRHEFAFYEWHFLLTFNLIMDTILDIPNVLKDQGGRGKENGRHSAKRELFFFCMEQLLTELTRALSWITASL